MFYWNPASMNLSWTFWCSKALFHFSQPFVCYTFSMSPQGQPFSKEASLGMAYGTFHVRINSISVYLMEELFFLISLWRELWCKPRFFSACLQPQHVSLKPQTYLFTGQYHFPKQNHFSICEWVATHRSTIILSLMYLLVLSVKIL